MLGTDRLRGAGADRGQRAGRARRRLQPRLRALRDARRRAALRGPRRAGWRRCGRTSTPSRPPLREQRPDVPPALEDVIRRALAKAPDGASDARRRSGRTCSLAVRRAALGPPPTQAAVEELRGEHDPPERHPGRAVVGRAPAGRGLGRVEQAVAGGRVRRRRRLPRPPRRARPGAGCCPSAVRRGRARPAAWWGSGPRRRAMPWRRSAARPGSDPRRTVPACARHRSRTAARLLGWLGDADRDRRVALEPRPVGRQPPWSRHQLARDRARARRQAAPAGVARRGAQRRVRGGREVAGVDRDRWLDRPWTGRQHRGALERWPTSTRHDRLCRVRAPSRCRLRAVEAAGGDQQRAAGVQVGVGRRLGVHHVAVLARGTRCSPSGRWRLSFVQLQILSKRRSSPIAAASSMPYACPSPTVSSALVGRANASVGRRRSGSGSAARGGVGLAVGGEATAVRGRELLDRRPQPASNDRARRLQAPAPTPTISSRPLRLMRCASTGSNDDPEAGSARFLERRPSIRS